MRALRKFTENNRLLFRLLIGGVFICTACFLLFVPYRQQTLSIVVKPCGNDTNESMKSEAAGIAAAIIPSRCADPRCIGAPKQRARKGHLPHGVAKT
jgi:hypothetical protein